MHDCIKFQIDIFPKINQKRRRPQFDWKASCAVSNWIPLVRLSMRLAIVDHDNSKHFDFRTCRRMDQFDAGYINCWFVLFSIVIYQHYMQGPRYNTEDPVPHSQLRKWQLFIEKVSWVLRHWFHLKAFQENFLSVFITTTFLGTIFGVVFAIVAGLCMHGTFKVRTMREKCHKPLFIYVF